jgi:hypothetical protein
MTMIEDRLRAATHAAADTIPAQSAPPLHLPQPTRRTARGPSRLRGHRLTWRLVAPLAAAAAVIAVIATSVALTGGNHPRPVAPPPPPGQRQVPPYYMYLPLPYQSSQYSAVIRSTATGAKIATVLPPKSDQFVAVSGASDDRTFALSAGPRTWRAPKSCTSPQSPSCWPPFRLYLARFNPANGAVTLRALPIPAIQSADTLIALSPSGTELAVGTLLGAGNLAVTQIREYSLTSDTVKVWEGQGSISSMAWAPNGQLAFDWVGAEDADGIRMLNASTAEGSLVGASRLIVSDQQPAHYTLRPSAFGVSGDGKTIVAAFNLAIWRSRPAGAEIRWYSVATGRETRVYTPPAATYTYSWQVLWTNSSGSVTVLYRSVPSKTDRSDYFGVVSGNKFVELPGVAASEFPGLEAAF